MYDSTRSPNYTVRLSGNGPPDRKHSPRTLLRRSCGFFFGVLAALTIVAFTPSRPLAAVCGQPTTEGSQPTATDALSVLRSAVHQTSCALCICDVDASLSITASDALRVLIAAVKGQSLSACAECDQCPAVAQFALFASTRGPCASNADCSPFAACDPSVGRCRTLTRLDSGWTGLAHGGDANDTVPARLFLDCPTEAPCDQCEITALDPVLGNCRCAQDNRIPCFNPHSPDDACGGETCECYFGPPLPLSSGNSPTCVINRLSGAPGGLVNVDQGSGAIELNLAPRVHLGISNLAPCPYCDSDPQPGDGVRGGNCIGGLNDGESCDGQSGNTTFPYPTGAAHSLDCFPAPGANISGAGLDLNFALSTGTTTLASNVACGGNPSEQCPCRVCTGDATVACNSDDECSQAGLGTCASDGAGVPTLPNACDDGVCADQGAGIGACASGPVDTFCDAVLRPDGRGIVQCNTNQDCAIQNAGNCDLFQLRQCFLDPIVTSGIPHPLVPTAAAAYCVAPTSSVSINSVAGLPGPGRLVYQALLSLFCASNPAATYAPGIGGCP